MSNEISPEELCKLLTEPEVENPLLLDVREPWEWELTHIPGSLHIPMHLIPSRHNELEDRFIVTICHHGVRSLQVTLFLKNVGFENVVSLRGGLNAWSERIDDSILRY
jgi:rhodanese-related sulfurtransferase